jgi:hypothetical protein
MGRQIAAYISYPVTTFKNVSHNYLNNIHIIRVYDLYEYNINSDLCWLNLMWFFLYALDLTYFFKLADYIKM